jgi:N-methylhydantoinase A/oxoprolinase/acetone carboxylase beta subunit
MEHEAAAIIREIVSEAQITLSGDVGQVGLLERENAEVLNACLGRLAREKIAAFRQAISELGITAPLYITQDQR